MADKYRTGRRCDYATSAYLGPEAEICTFLHIWMTYPYDARERVIITVQKY
jgi:hypothetical protein